MAAKSTLRSIGQVLSGLKGEFPDISISKIRFLESEGLLSPERAPSGYRRYAEADVERLRYILTAQRNHYLPLRVIREQLARIDAGQRVPPLAGLEVETAGIAEDGSEGASAAGGHAGPVVQGAPGPGGPASGIPTTATPPTNPLAAPLAAPTTQPNRSTPAPASPSASDRAVRKPPIRLSRADLLKASGLSEPALAELERIQVIQPRRGTHHYGREALALAVAAKRLAVYGIDSRHLRAFKMAADREIGLVEQAIAPHVRRSKNGSEVSAEVTQLIVSVHAALIRIGMDR